MKINLKKLFVTGTLVGLGLCTLMLILTIFKINFFEGTKLSLLITTACLTVGGYFSISSYHALNKNKILGIVSFVLIWVSVLLVTISGWIDMSGLFGDITLTIALLSVLFNFIVSNTLKLGKNYKAIQILCNLILSVFIVLILLMTYEILTLTKIGSFFWIMLILSIVSFITISVLANKSKDEETSSEYIKIKKSEYELLLNKAKQLDELLNKKESN